MNKQRSIGLIVLTGVLLLAIGLAPNLSGGQLTGSISAGHVVQAGDGAKLDTSINLVKSTPKVGYQDDSANMDHAVFQTLNITVTDTRGNTVSIKESDFELTYTRAPGNQDVLVHYKGSDSYNETYADAVVNITKARDTRVVLTSNPGDVTLQGSKDAMDNALYNVLGIQVVDSQSNKINFNQGDISMSYNMAVGTQDVTVRFGGNDNYGPSVAKVNVKFTSPVKTKIIVNNNRSKVQYQGAVAALDAAVIKDLGIQVQDKDGNTVTTADGEVTVSYNREAGTQPVTIHYNGNDQYAASNGDATAIIINPQPVSVVVSSSPDMVFFNDDQKQLDADVLKNLDVKVYDANQKEVKISDSDLTLSYDRARGDQDVKVTYKGNDDYQPATATAKITIGESIQNIGIGVGAILGILAVVIIILVWYRANHKKQTKQEIRREEIPKAEAEPETETKEPEQEDDEA